IGGGFGNKVGNNNADVNDAPFGTVAGGVFNGAAGYASTVGGGDGNFAAGIRSTIAGGAGNQALSQDSFVGGGGANIILGNSQGALIGGGSGNTIQTNATNSSILAGLNNLIEAKSVSSTINAGTRNRIRLGFFGTISCTIGGGEANVIDTVDARYATIAGGYGNTNNDVGATIGGGYGNTANGAEATVAGGYGNIASQGQSTVGGGFQNTSIGSAATVAGGGNNTSSGNNATVGGGGLNKSTADGATVAGGANGVSSAVYATVGGGDFNIASGTGATVPGGNDNRAAGRNSFAAGQGARANHDGSFVWTDSQFIIGGFGSSGPDQFIVRARGGSRFFGGDLWDVNNTEGDFRIGTDAYRFKIGVAQGGGGAGDVWMRPHGGTGRVILKTPGGTIIYSNEGQTAGVSLAAGGGGWTTVSDRNAKEHFAKVNGRDVLDKVVSMPVQSWNYKAQASSIRHIGVMAQDFYAAFHVGETNIGITTVDADGVALAAIQGLNEKLDERDAEIQNLKEKNSSLEAKFNELAATVRALAGKK
ncbi:MAG TPA: tail fiber domain-containing protein, partial [Candidatus Saccharimonadales bacterium]|nr:tail fiber domain-containing protein [Candidatus Saccharimonadales bacterium]